MYKYLYISILLLFILIINGCTTPLYSSNDKPLIENISSDCIKITYAENQKIEVDQLNFRFEIEYLGKRIESYGTKDQPIAMTFYDFKITTNKYQKTLNWSGGTGDVGPVLFSLNGEEYSLELKKSDHFEKWLEENQMVICKK